MPLATTDKIHLLSTRELNDTLFEKANQHQVTLEAIPFISVQPVETTQNSQLITALDSQEATVIFTSVNAVETVVQQLPKKMAMPNWKIYCIGGATFTAVKKYWPYNNVLFTAKNASDLAINILQQKPANVVFFCGDQRRQELPDLLLGKVQLTEVVVYNTVETPVKITKFYHGVLFFSPSAVKSFFSLNTLSPGTIAFVIGNTTAKAVQGYSSNQLIESDFPAKDQLLTKSLAHFLGNEVI